MAEVSPDSLHRLAKQTMDSGRAQTVEEAEAILGGYRVGLLFEGGDDPSVQAALLTCVALSSRVFLGGVTVTGKLDVPQRSPLPEGPMLIDAVKALGGRAGEVEDGVPAITIGASGPVGRKGSFHVRTAYAGWRGGILPADASYELKPASVMPLAAMLAAALAVSEAYRFVSGAPTAGRLPVGLSLWDLHADWLRATGDEPVLTYLPTRLWLIGLGHLGQAYLWGLGLLPYAKPQEVELVLQDVDRITVSTPSTSILSTADMKGRRKTREMAAWAERRGFETRLHERLFDGAYRRQDDEPAVALCGLDNAEGRRALDGAGFDLVVEAGLGRDFRNFQTIRLHTLPARRRADEIWPDARGATEAVETNPAYQALLESGRLDQCGMTLLAGKAVGASFVGSVAACLVLSEVLRVLGGGQANELIDLDLRSVEHVNAVTQSRDYSKFNPGYTIAS